MLENRSNAKRMMLGPEAILLSGFAERRATELLAAIDGVCSLAPFRHMVTRRGLKMSVAMTNCGDAGWITDRSGYRYDSKDPQTGLSWPAMPASLSALATAAAVDAGFNGFAADACLINRYGPGARMALHQDRDEREFLSPIVSVSLGLPATFLWGGHQRTDRPTRIRLGHGDVVVWGGVDRLRFHGVSPLTAGMHPLTGSVRYNLTFRRAR